MEQNNYYINLNYHEQDIIILWKLVEYHEDFKKMRLVKSSDNSKISKKLWWKATYNKDGTKREVKFRPATETEILLYAN